VVERAVVDDDDLELAVGIVLRLDGVDAALDELLLVVGGYDLSLTVTPFLHTYSQR
jgi:hypothetical protein